ncbi:MAG: ABC-2 family transporter protein [Armatimonadetes bacterium]|nr:ABC-2 family transporter protein [Anaerolineae bacterium]
MRMLRVMGLYLKVSILNELQYRVNFFVQIFQSALALLVALGGLAIVFTQTDALSGWTQPELVAVLGVYFMVGGVVGALIQPSMALLMEDIQQGTLDYAILKPVETQLLISVRRVEIWKLLDVLLGIGLLLWSVSQMGKPISLLNLGAFGLLLVAGCAMVYSFWLMLATIAFWFIRVDNILGVFQSMYEAGRYPVRIYPNWLQLLLTFLVPVAFAVTVPTEALTGRLTPATFAAALGLAGGLLLASRIFWGYGIRAYSGASA